MFSISKVPHMKLTGTITRDQVRTLRKNVDIYEWRGIICARTWPRTSGRLRTPGMILSAQRFKRAKLWIPHQ